MRFHFSYFSFSSGHTVQVSPALDSSYFLLLDQACGFRMEIHPCFRDSKSPDSWYFLRCEPAEMKCPHVPFLIPLLLPAIHLKKSPETTSQLTSSEPECGQQSHVAQAGGYLIR